MPIFLTLCTEVSKGGLYFHTFSSLIHFRQAKDGQPLEKIAQHFIQAKIIRPQVRPYRTNNYYAALIRQDKLEQEVQRIVHH